MIWLEAALTGDRIAEATDEVGHSALPLVIATIVTDVDGKGLDLNKGVRDCFIQ